MDKTVYEFTQLKGIPGAVRDAGPDAWGRRVIEHKLERGAGDLREIDYLLRGPQDGAGYLSFGLKAEPPAPKRRYNRTHQLTELVAVTQAIEEGRPIALEVLEQLDPGTSLGGARPHTAQPSEQSRGLPPQRCRRLPPTLMFGAWSTALTAPLCGGERSGD